MAPPYFEARAALARNFIEPNYADAGSVGVAELRAEWQAMLSAISDKMNAVIARAGKDMEEGPVNPHLATIHHTGMLIAFDQAKDHAMKYVLASACAKAACGAACVRP
jgi:hypothetical protein